MSFICIDVGATNTLVGVGVNDFEAIEKYSTQYFLENISAVVEAVVNETGQRSEDIDKVATAVAGPIDRGKGEFYPPNLPIEKVNLTGPLSRYGEVQIMNDATAAVAGEYFYGKKNAEDMLYITFSTGIGSGVVVDGNVLEGWAGNLGEIGHMCIGDQGLECGCGGMNHWEAYSSGEGMPKMAEELYDAEFDDSREIFAEYRQGNEKAVKTIEEMQRKNAEGFANVINLYNPEIIWIGGAVALNHFQTVVEEPLQEIDDQIVNSKPIVEKTTLGEETVLHGLKAACKEELNI